MLIANATIVTVDENDRILDPGWIEVTDGRISAVASEPIAPRPGERTIDATGKVVLPGLVNAHTHLFQVLIRGVYERLPFAEWLRRIYACGLALSEADFELGARLGALEALLGGTTTIVEHHFLNGRPDGPSATIAGMRAMGIRTVFARTAIDMGTLAPAAILESPEDAVKACEALLEAQATAAGVGDRMLSILVGPNTPGISASGAMALAMGELAGDRGLRQSMHLSESRTVVEQVERDHGVHGVARWLDGIGALRGPALAAHSVHLDQGELGLLAERDVAIVHNPVSNLFLGDGIAPIREAIDAGVRVAIGTDGAASNNAQDMFEVTKLASLLQRARHEDPLAVRPTQALRMATIEGARAVGLGDVIGSIEVGKRADLVTLNLLATPRTVALHDAVSQIVHCTPTSAVDTVMVNGRVLVEGGEAVGLDQAALLAEAQAAGRGLVERLPV